jgi:hypothetical protein
MIQIEDLVDRYLSWLKDRTLLRTLKGATEITTPYLDRHNDYIQIYAKPDDLGLTLTDDGYTLDDLEASGCSLSSTRRQALLKVTLNGFGVKLHDGALTVHATPDNFPIKKHNLIQAMLAVNDLFYLVPSITKSLFAEDVMDWLDLSDIRYVPRMKFSGASGFDHVFDFTIPKSRVRPERVLRAISSPSRDKAESFAFAWHDTREARPPHAMAYAMLNDNERPVTSSVTDALQAYGIRPIAWSHREQVREELAA